MERLKSLFEDYQKTLDRLRETIEHEKTDMVRDSAIKRFELSFDVSWKLVKIFLEEEKGLQCRSPKDCFREAFQQEIIDYDDYWITMTDWRNVTVHTYKEELAEKLYKELPKALEKFEELENNLRRYV